MIKRRDWGPGCSNYTVVKWLGTCSFRAIHRKLPLIVKFVVRFVTSALLFIRDELNWKTYSDHQRDWLKVWEGELEYRKIATFHGIGVNMATKEECCSFFCWQAQNVGSRLAGVDEEEKPHHPNSILLTAKSKFVMLWNKNSLEHENVESWSWRSGNVSLQCDIFEQDYSQTFLAPSEGEKCIAAFVVSCWKALRLHWVDLSSFWYKWAQVWSVN